jgi:o-succinylbenzoate synthase
MKIAASISKVDFQFITPGKTSRGVLYSKPSWFISLSGEGKSGIGECSVIPDLNPEFTDGYENKVHEVADKINNTIIPQLSDLDDFPSIQFGLETALLDLNQDNQGVLFPSAFTFGDRGISINGLVWMGSKSEMKNRIREKLNSGFKVLKLKVGALDFKEELDLLKNIRKEFNHNYLEIRLDANGAFNSVDALEKLKWLSDHQIHSIEQPIRAGQWDDMAKLCNLSPIPIALDEELIGIKEYDSKKLLLSTIKPCYIILKPSLIGGFAKSDEWIKLAESLNIDWWATSALESNVGLNAIAQWVFTKNPKMVQGLGTGQVFSNNIPSPLELRGPELFYNVGRKWGEIG